MHKLSKGLKKKIKGKKGKDKEDDLFDPAILEQYRRDKATAAAAAAAAEESEQPQHGQEDGSPGSPEAEGAVAASPATEKPESEEWLKFKLLTSGVDSILQKTQEDLGRIKKTSYFQRNKKAETPTPGEEAKPIVQTGTPCADAVQTPSRGRWIGFEEGAIEDQESEEIHRNPENSQQALAEVTDEPEVFPEVEEEETGVEDDDIFNTEYIDALTSGELKLAYVPDSPTEEKPEDDPFDTSVVEKIVGPLPVIKKKRQLVSIGAAAEILTVVDEQKRTQHRDSNRQRTREPPNEIQLLCCFDDEDVRDQSRVGSKAATPFDLPATSAQPSPYRESAESPSPAAPTEPILKDILAEFDAIPETDDPIDDEDFIVKPSTPLAPPVPAPKPELVDEEDFEFEALAYESLAKNPQPILPVEQEGGDDPFDTSSVEKVLAKDLCAQSAPVESSVAPVKNPATGAPPPARPAPPSRPSRPRAPQSKVSLAAAVAALIDPALTQQLAGTIATPTTAAPLQPQDSFEALFLSDDPVSSCVPPPVAVVTAQLAAAAVIENDPLEGTAFEELSNDPFDTSVADRLDAGLTLPQHSAAPLIDSDPSNEATARVSNFTFLDDEPTEEDDPFDTSAVEKILH